MSEDIKEEVRKKVEEEHEQHSEEKSAKEKAMEAGWKPDGVNIFGETVSPERFLQEKELYNTIGRLKTSLKVVDKKLAEVQDDNIKMAKAFTKEKQQLIDQLKVEREKALTNLEVDQVRDIDKQIEKAQEDMKEAPSVDKSPYYDSFLEENEWASDDEDVRTIAAEAIAIRYAREHPNAGDKALYDHIHKAIREKFPEKFSNNNDGDETHQKVAAVNKRTTDVKHKKKTVALDDLDPEEQRVVRVMANAVGKTVEEYMKNYSFDRG